MRRLVPLLHVERMQQCGLPGQELLHLLLWKTEKVQKDRNRKRNGELLDEVAAPLVLEGAHKFPRPPAYCSVQRKHFLRRDYGVQHLPHLARKSVVSGKSVSVRIDFGGRRFIKKKKK